MQDIITAKKLVLFLLISGVFLLTLALSLLYYPELKDPVVFFFTLLASNTFLGIPHEPLLIYYGKIYPVYLPPLFAIVPTILGCMLDYMILKPILQSRYLERLRNHKSYKNSVRYFNKFPFITLIVFAVSPLPFYPVRLMSISTNYPLHKYASAVTIGRVPRYMLLALGGFVFDVPNYLIVTFFVVLLIVPFVPQIVRKLKTLLITSCFF